MTSPKPTSPSEDSTFRPSAEDKEQDLSTSEPSNTKETPSSISSAIESKPESIRTSSPTSNTVTTQVADEQQWLTGMALFTVMLGTSVPCILLLLDMSIVSTAIPRITSEFHSLPDVGWYGAAYQVSTAALQPLTGRFYTNFHTKWTFLAFFTLFELGSLVCGVANSSVTLIVGRAIAGMGGSGIMNGALTIIAGVAPGPKRPALMGILVGTSQIGLVLGPLLGGVLTQYTTWRWCFYINLPIGGVVAALLVFINIPEPLQKQPPLAVLKKLHTQLDLMGFLLFAPAAIQLLLALEYGGNKFAWNSAQIIGLFCGAGGTLIVFLAWEYYKGDEAMLPFSMLSNRVVWSSSLAYGFFMGQQLCVSYFLPIYFQAVKGVSPTLSGVYILPAVIPHIMVSFSSGWLLGKVGYYLPFAIVGSAFVAIANGLLGTLKPRSSTGDWFGFQVLAGVGRGLALQIVSGVLSL